MYEELDEGATEVDTTPFQFSRDPTSIAPLAVDVVAPLSMHEQSTSFSWPPPPPARASSASIYAVAAVSIVSVLGLLVSFALTETLPTPAAAVVPRSVEITTSKSASFLSAPARETLSAH